MSEKLDCREAVARLQDYLKHELTPERAEELKAHREYCRPCLGHARFEQRFLEMLEAKARRSCCPDELRARIMRELAELEQG
jgi:anti-sigma factor (TIGR02949 family)